MALWLVDGSREAVVEKAHSVVTRIGFRYCMAMFILSEVMFFRAFFCAFFNAALFPTPATGFRWPPEGIEPIDAFDVPLLMTLILLLSGSTLTLAHHALPYCDNAASARAFGPTVLLCVFCPDCLTSDYVSPPVGVPTVVLQRS